MLIRYKKDFEKIAMGLLSFIPDLKDVKMLQKTIKEYEANPDCHLFLWRDDDVIGAIGVRIDGDNAVIEHISVNPSFRNIGIGKKMIEAVKKLYEEKYTVSPSEVLQDFYAKCFDQNETDE